MAKGEIVPADAASEGPTGTDLDLPAEAKVPAKSGGKSGPSGGGKSGRPEPGFFTIYKKGQGKWTRLGTVFAAAALGLLTGYSIYQYALPYLPATDSAHPNALPRELLFVGVVLFLAAFGLVTYWLTNRAGNVDFLIATDSEMKKVNWTTKGELFGSTRVVVLFLVVIALFLFAVDLAFQWFFHAIRVLQ